MNEEKRKKLKECQYAENCYRKNPTHFSEYSHIHLDKIYENGYDSQTKEYKIPNELFMSKEIILIQLKLLEKLFPRKEEKKTPFPQNIIEIGDEVQEQVDESETKTMKNDGTTGYRLCDGKQISTSKRFQSPEASVCEKASSSNLSKKPKITKNIRDYIPVVIEKGQMATKLKNAAPYNFFLTAITDCKPTHHEPLSITLQEILDESLGEIESSVQINFMVDIGWLLGHYYFAGILDTPLLVLYGDETPELKTISQHKPQVTAIKVNMPTPYATSHTKMMLLGYKDNSMRVVISTANLYEDDWHNRTQGLWISPLLKQLPEDADTTAGESPTGFRQDLLLYLIEYKIPKLQPWISRIRKTDFSSINVFLVASVPGSFRDSPKGFPWGHPRLGYLLSKHASSIDERVPVVCQSSSIGSLGQNVQSWILNDFVNSLRKDSQAAGIRKIPPFKMIYPSFNNVKNSHDDLLGGGCLPYCKNTNDKQPWLKEHLHQWIAKQRHRSQAMPHIKTYTRYNEEGIFWFVLTSANLSKAAWGAFNKSANISAALRINNFEAGVLFLPKFVIRENTFPMNTSRNGVPPFPIPYDVPLTPYGSDDTPFLMDCLQK